MKATVIAVFVALFAVAAATEMPEEGVFGDCPRIDGPLPTYLMDTKYRNVFYECSNRKPIRHICPEGLVFDPRKNVCDHPCIDCKPYGPVGTCAADNVKPYPHTHLRDGVNLAVYYFCWSQRDPWMYECPEGKYYNTIEKKCQVLPFH